MKHVTKVLICGLTVVTVLSLATAGWAFWSTTGSGTGSSSVATLAPPTAVSVPATSTGSVAIGWTASSTASPNVAPTGYYVQRFGGTSQTAACGTSPSSLIAALSCTDTGVPDGTYTYKITAAFRSWSASSASSSEVVVTNLALTSVSPPSRGQGATSQTLTLNGAGFTSGAAVSFSGTGITVNSVSVVSATQVSANISVAATATPGPRNVTVTNGDGGVAVLVNGFTVNARPIITSPSAASTAKVKKGTTAAITVTGTGFVNGITATITGDDFSGGTVSWNSSTQIMVTVNAPPGNNKRGTITVTNPDGGTFTAPDSLESTN